MELTTLIATMFAFITPYLTNTGEAIAQKVGEDIWNVVRKIFFKNDENLNLLSITKNEDKDKFASLLFNKLMENEKYRLELEKAIRKGEEELRSFYNQNINNNNKIEKQINIQNNKGSIVM